MTYDTVESAYAAGHAAGLREANDMLTEILRVLDEYEASRAEIPDVAQV